MRSDELIKIAKELDAIGAYNTSDKLLDNFVKIAQSDPLSDLGLGKFSVLPGGTVNFTASPSSNTNNFPSGETINTSSSYNPNPDCYLSVWGYTNTKKLRIKVPHVQAEKILSLQREGKLPSWNDRAFMGMMNKYTETHGHGSLDPKAKPNFESYKCLYKPPVVKQPGDASVYPGTPLSDAAQKSKDEVEKLKKKIEELEKKVKDKIPILPGKKDDKSKPSSTTSDLEELAKKYLPLLDKETQDKVKEVLGDLKSQEPSQAPAKLRVEEIKKPRGPLTVNEAMSNIVFETIKQSNITYLTDEQIYDSMNPRKKLLAYYIIGQDKRLKSKIVESINSKKSFKPEFKKKLIQLLDSKIAEANELNAQTETETKVEVPEKKESPYVSERGASSYTFLNSILEEWEVKDRGTREFIIQWPGNYRSFMTKLKKAYDSRTITPDQYNYLRDTLISYNEEVQDKKSLLY
jgi:hypothetical protein